MGAVLCEIDLKGVDDLCILLLPPFLWTVVSPCITVFPNYLIVGNLTGQPRIFSHKDTLVLSEACPARTVNPTPLSSAPPISHGFCFPPPLRLFATCSNRVVVYIDCS